MGRIGRRGDELVEDVEGSGHQLGVILLERVQQGVQGGRRRIH